MLRGETKRIDNNLIELQITDGKNWSNFWHVIVIYDEIPDFKRMKALINENNSTN